MSRIQIKLTGAKAVVAFLLVAAFMGYRYLNATSTIESDAAEELKFWLQGQYASRLMAESPQPTEETARRALALDNIQFSEINGRGTPSDMIVRVRILVNGSPPPDGRPVRYFRMEYSQLTKWKLVRETTGLAYNLNFL